MIVLSSGGTQVRLEKDARLVSLFADGCAVVSELPPVFVGGFASESPERFMIQVGSLGDSVSTPNLLAMGGQITGLNFFFPAGTIFSVSLSLGTIVQLYFEEVQL